MGGDAGRGPAGGTRALISTVGRGSGRRRGGRGEVGGGRRRVARVAIGFSPRFQDCDCGFRFRCSLASLALVVRRGAATRGNDEVTEDGSQCMPTTTVEDSRTPPELGLAWLDFALGQSVIQERSKSAGANKVF